MLWLADTGGLLALLNPRDRWHRRCVEAFATLRLPLATSAAVLAELFHLVGDHPADATLVHLAARESLTTVFTVDHADFETFRIPGGRTFRVVPGR